MNVDNKTKVMVKLQKDTNKNNGGNSTICILY